MNIDEIMNRLPMGSYESGWSQPMLFPIGRGSISYKNGIRFGVQQKNWRTNEERFESGISVIDALDNFLAEYELVATDETLSSATMNY